MTHSNEALSRLRGITLEDLTTEQMDSVLGPSSISPNVIAQFEQAILIAGARAAQRTYGSGGLPIPEDGAVGQYVVLAAPEGGTDIRPPGTEIWDIKHIRAFGNGGTASGTIAFSDGTYVADIIVAASIPLTGANFDLNNTVSSPVLITNSLYLRVTETGGSVAMDVAVAYQVVGK